MNNIKVWVDYWQTTLNTLGYRVLEAVEYERENYSPPMMPTPLFRFGVMELATGRITWFAVPKDELISAYNPIVFLIGEIYRAFNMETMLRNGISTQQE